MLCSLYLIRHGEAEGEEDPPLSLQGIKDIEKIASFLRQKELHLDTIYHSVKRRARQTALIIANQLNVTCVEKEGLKPNDPIAPFIVDFETWNEKNVAIVSHLPFLSNLISTLVLGEEWENIFDLRGGSVVALKNEAGVWKISWMVSPFLL